MELIAQNLPEALLVAGIAALIVEVALLGFSTFILFFFGLSLLLSGLAMLLGLLPETLTAALWFNAILTAVLALSLWQPLRRMQNQREQRTLDSDFARQTLVLEDDVDAQGKTGYRYSGVQWQLKSEQPISKGTLVEVVRADVGVLWVRPKA